MPTQITATVSVEEAAKLLGISRAGAYLFAKRRGEVAPGVPVVRISQHRVRVPLRPLAELLRLSDEEVLERLAADGERRGTRRGVSG